MDMDIEDKIRSRIEAILLNDARNCAELRMAASDDDPVESDPFAEERNLYQRIISSYRSAVSEVNSLLEENVGFLSGFYRIVEGIKDQDNFPEICSQIVDCILQDMGAEYCGLVFHTNEAPGDDFSCFEGIREQRKFMCGHAGAALLGCPEFSQAIDRLSGEVADCVNIKDVYREARFNNVDFPSVVRSLVCLPIRVRGESVGTLILSNSLPHYFTENHTRVLKILASTIAHLRLLTSGRIPVAAVSPASAPQAVDPEGEEPLSVVLLSFESDGSARRLLADRETIRNIRVPLASLLNGRESIVLYGDCELLALLPGTAADHLFARAEALVRVFEEWKTVQGEKASSIRMRVGYSTCEGGEDLSRTLEVASLMMCTRQGEDAPAHAGCRN